MKSFTLAGLGLVYAFSGFNRNGSHRLIFEFIGSSIRSLIGGNVSLGEGFGVSEVEARPSVSPSSCCLPV